MDETSSSSEEESDEEEEEEEPELEEDKEKVDGTSEETTSDAAKQELSVSGLEIKSEETSEQTLLVKEANSNSNDYDSKPMDLGKWHGFYQLFFVCKFQWQVEVVENGQINNQCEF